MKKLYPRADKSVNDGAEMSPVVEKIGQLHFDGNITPHCWYQSPLLQNEKGKPNLVAITLLADIMYWYRPTILRDEVSGVEIGRRQKFAADKLQKNYRKWGNVFGFTLRQVEDAMAFMKSRILVTVEVRAVVTEYGTYPNCAFIEPVFDTIKEIMFPSPEKTGDRPMKNGRSLPKNRALSPEKTGEPGLKNESSLPKKREHSKTILEAPTETKTEIPLPPAPDPATNPHEDEEEIELNSKDLGQSNEAGRADGMIKHLIGITKDRSEQDSLRDLALQCVRMEHKDAWKHTLKTVKNRMLSDDMLFFPNKFAAKVLKTALENMVQDAPLPPAAPGAKAAAKEPSTARSPDAAACQEYYDKLDNTARKELDEAVIKATNPEWRKSPSCIKANRDKIIADKINNLQSPSAECQPPEGKIRP